MYILACTVRNEFTQTWTFKIHNVTKNNRKILILIADES